MQELAASRHLRIRPVRPAEAEIWVRLRCELWPDGAADHAPEIADFFAGRYEDGLMAALIAELPEHGIIGFAELGIRTELPGLPPGRIGYLEGLYVRPEIRHQGIGRALARASRTWAREQGRNAFASDRADRIVIDRRF